MAFSGVSGKFERAAFSWFRRLLAQLEFADPFATLSKEECQACLVFIAAHL
jgi:hypothetical protein